MSQVLKEYKGRKVKLIEARPLMRLAGSDSACALCLLYEDRNTCDVVPCGVELGMFAAARSIYVYDDDLEEQT